MLMLKLVKYPKTHQTDPADKVITDGCVYGNVI